MTKRSQWCEFDKETRKEIKKRDKDRCIICGSTGALQIAHIWVSRAHGGKGCKENGVILCTKCHQELDNYIGSRYTHDLIEKYCKDYLIKKENLNINKSFLDSLVYHKSL